MAGKKLPWAGSYKNPGNPGDQYAPSPGSYAPPSPKRADDTKTSSDPSPWLAKDFGQGEVRETGRK